MVAIGLSPEMKSRTQTLVEKKRQAREMRVTLALAAASDKGL
jgi:hypothetical protein